MNRRDFITRVSAAAGSLLAPQSIMPSAVLPKARKIIPGDKIDGTMFSLDFNLVLMKEVPQEIISPDDGFNLSQAVTRARNYLVNYFDSNGAYIDESFKTLEAGGKWADVKAKVMLKLNSPYSIAGIRLKELFENGNSLEEVKSGYLKLYENVAAESTAKIDEIETNLIETKQIKIREGEILPKNATVRKQAALQRVAGGFLDEARVWLPTRYEVDIPRLWIENREWHLHRTKQVAENFTNYFGQNAVEKIIVPYAGKLLIKPNYKEISDFFTEEVGDDVKGFSSKVDCPMTYPELLLIDFLERNSTSAKTLLR